MSLVLPVVLFLFQDAMQGSTLHLVVMFPQILLSCDSFSDFLCFDNLDSFEETVQVFYRLSLNWDFLMFLRIRLG